MERKKKAKFFIHFDSLSSDKTFFLSLSEISLFLSQFVDKETTVIILYYLSCTHKR